MRKLSVLLLCLTLGLVLAPAARAEEVQTDEAHRAAVTRALLALESDQGWSPEEIRDRLYAMDDRALPGILDALAQVAAGSPTAGILADFLATSDEQALDKALRGWLGADPSLSTQLRTLRLFSRLQDIRVLPLAVEIVSGIDESVLVDRRIQRTWQTTFRALAGKDARSRELVKALEALPAELAGPTAKALAELDGPQAVEACVALLDKRPEVAAPILVALRRAAPVDLHGADVRRLILLHMEGEDVAARAAAPGVAARGRHVAAVPALVNLLDDKDPRVQSAATTALQALTGTHRGRTATSWKTWLEAEATWRKESDVDERLRAGRDETVIRALQDVVRHRYACRELVAELGALSEDGGEAIRRLACAALQALGRLEAAPWLVARLRDRNEEVREAAEQALRALTGLDLGPEPADWRARLAGR